MPTGNEALRQQMSKSQADQWVAGFVQVEESNTDADKRLLAEARKLLRARHQLDRLLPEKDLQRHAVWSVLFDLYANEGEGGVLHVKQAMSVLGEKPSTAIRTIDRMEEVGLICREPDSADRRCVIVRLTDAGRAIALHALRNIFDNNP